jgi:VWA domain containing CoxE-like protein
MTCIVKFEITVLLLAATLVLCVSAAAQSADSCLSPHIIVNVVDKQGKIVPGLASESFQVRAGDQTVMVKSALASAGTQRVVLLVDISGSISKSQHVWDIARVAAGNLLVAAPSTLRVALVLFSDRIIDTIGFDRPAPDIVERLAKLENGKGSTAILDSIDYSIKLLQPAGHGDAIYIISDGGENASKSHGSDVERELVAQGVRLFAFILQPKAPFATPEEAAAPNLLVELTKVSGGAVVDEDSVAALDSQPKLSAVLHSGYEQMAHFYDLQLSIPDRGKKKERLRLDIIDQDGKKRKDVSVSYPQYLLPCTH